MTQTRRDGVLRGFAGRTLQPVFERGLASVPAWIGHSFDAGRLIARMRDGIKPVPGAAELLLATAALGLPLRVASNSSHEEMAEKFARCGLSALVRWPHAQRADVGVGQALA